MTSHASTRNGGMLITRNELSMPKWVAEQNDRVGPRPPPPPLTPENGHVAPKQPNLPPKAKQPEPDYEVIEFSNQQYSNAPLRPNSASSGSKTPDNKLKCTLCGSGNPWVTCEACSQQIFCASCDDMFHKHPKRKSHQRKTIDKSRPPLPPKILPGQTGPTPPVAPPRRNKRGFMTPILQRKDQGNAMPGQFPESTSPTPSMKNASWQERLGSLPRGLNLLNRPLPETPKTPSESSRSTTPKSVFDNIQRPPSVVLEKIKSKANATLDRMQLLQQRYRQQKEQMDRERSGSLTDQRQMALQHHQIAMQRSNQLGQRGMSSSVLNLNQINRKQPVINNGWLNNSLQQAQSMAQLNCGNCAQQQLQWNGYNQHHMHKAQEPWNNQLASQQHLNRSNMSLNVPAGYMMQQQMNNMYPPPTFMNQRNLMPHIYPQPYMGGMPVMNPGLICMPPYTSRAASRSGSRMASPAMSRKSVTLRRKQRSNYIDDEATDDEDSDEDDRRSITSIRSGVSRSRQRLAPSASQFLLDDDMETTPAKLHRNRARNQRRDSIAKSVHNDWTPGIRTSSMNNNRSADSGFNSPRKASRIYSDLDSEGSGTRALVQAKIEQKLKEDSLKQRESKSKRQSKSPPPQKTCAAVQTPAIKQTNKQEKIKKAVAELVKQVEKASENELENKNQATKKKDSAEVLEKQAIATVEGGEEQEGGSENECESEQSIDSDSIHENGETEQTEEAQIEESNLGPPPSTPDHEWECEFCTFVNEANIKICSICCKTPSVKPKEAKKSTSPPKKETQHTRDENIKQTKHKNDTIKKNPLASSEKISTQNTKANNTESPPITNNVRTSKTDSTHITNDRNKSTRDSLKTKESVEDIWAAFDENIQATAHEITRKAESKKISKQPPACDSSSKSASVEPQENENDTTQSQAREIGTSPPPQNISTQTYDTLPIHKTGTRDKAIEKPVPEPLYNDAIQHSSFPLSPKIQDLKSFEAEVLNKIHNISHVPLHYHNRHVNHPIYSHNERQRYRSNNDLRIDDGMPMDFEAFNGLGKRQPSISELLLVQKTSSQMHSPFGGSTYDIPYHEPFSVRPNDTKNHKEADLYKYTTEELNAALKYCGPDMHPLVWLRDNWPKLIQTVQSLATKYGQERAENTIGTISQIEAREALRMHTGNIWQAVSECIEQRQRKYREIAGKGSFSREDIVTALTTQQGNVELALLDLGRTQLKPFLMRIWGSPGGVENESGSQPLLAATHSSPSYNMNKDIHSFLSANASACMQTPNATGAHLTNTNNQMPSPFDRPAPLNTPFESNNIMLDKISSYTTDSPPQLEESIRSNKNVLKDLELLIGNMEHSQQKQNEHLLRPIQEIIGNANPKTENEYDSESMRILTKSPIISPKFKTTSTESDSKNGADVKSFVWQHIQEIVPDLVQQVEMELVEDIENDGHTDDGQADEAIATASELKQIESIPPPPPIDQDEFLMEEVIKPNVKNASIREELPLQYFYAAEIATFQLAFDKGLEREHDEEFEYETLEEAPRQIYKMFKAPLVESLAQGSEVNQQITKTDVNFTETKVQLSENQIDPLNAVVLTKDENTSPHSPQMPVLELLPNYNENLQTKSEEAEIQAAASSETANEMLANDTQILSLDGSPQEGGISSDTKSEILMEISAENQSSIKGSFQTPEISDGIPTIPHKRFLDENYIKEPTTINAYEEFSDQHQKLSTPFEQTSIVQDVDLVAENNGTQTSKINQPIVSTEPANDIQDIRANATTTGEKRKPNKESKIRLKNTNQYKRTIIENSSKELDQAKSTKELNETINQDSHNSSYSEDSTTLFRSSAIPAPDISQAFDSSSMKNESNRITHMSLSERPNDNKAENDAPNVKNNNAVFSAQQIKNETIRGIEIKDLKEENSTAMVKKRMSKIPIRRTASKKSLINAFTVSNQIYSNGDVKSHELNSIATTTEVEIPRSISKMTDDESEAEELYSNESTTFGTEIASRADQFQSPSTSNEIFLVIQQEVSENTSTIAPSTSSSTLHSTTSQSSSFKSPTEFIPSGDPSKQNLTELVEDTQRLIKQMKDEISIDDFESSTDGEYSDEFSDEYDDEEEEEEEDWEDEEDEEYDDITEDITEENEVFSVGIDSISKTQSPLPSQESQDHRAIHNNSALSNTTESSNHSLALLYDNFEQEDPIVIKNTDIQIQNVTADETASFVETENNLPELPVETVVDNNLENSQYSMQFVEMENSLPEMSVDVVFSQDEKIITTQNHSITSNHYKEKMASVNSSRDLILVSTSLSNEVQSENAKEELTMESVEKAINLPQPEPESASTSQVSNTAISHTDSTTNEYNLTSTNIASNTPASQQNQLDEPTNNKSNASEVNDNVPSTSKPTKSSETKKRTNDEIKTSVKKSLASSKIPKPKDIKREPKPKDITKEAKQKEVLQPEPKNDFKKKYTRSKSFSGQSTPIGIASVKTISQKFISPSPNTQLMAPKKYHTAARKSSIVDTINKFTKPPTTTGKSAANSLFKSRTQPRIPKKKYHETCFSDDDYESSSDEEEIEPLEVRQRKLSVPVFKAYPSIQEPEEVNTDQLVEKFTKEKLSTTVAEAQIAAALVSMKFPQDVSLWAAKECSDLDHAIALLKQECELCSGTFALNQIVSMLKCTHKCCKQCAKSYFTVQITERSINDCSCPFCKLPELHNQTEHEDENLEYFSNLDIFLKSILEPEVHELFQRKLRDRTLLKDPNFKWCVQCSSGFFARPKQKRLICPDCGSVTCAQCRKTWQKQHEGISCDQFSEWESANDPDVQAKGVQQHLEQNGIDCPKCKFKYSLARGGCMHFTCTQCKYEFCYGCAKPFRMGAKCTVSPYCTKLGLHAHHPRNCLFYLRDKLPVQLQILLKNNNESFEVDPIRAADTDDGNEPSSSKKKELLCPIPIQKETPTGLVDTRCKGDVPEKHAGMCRNHYVEYLTAKVAKAKIDPLPIFDLTDCVQELRRRGIPLPERGPWDTDEIYKNMCAEVIQNSIPLDMD